MRQSINKHYDTHGGFSANSGQCLIASQAPPVSKDETMNQAQKTIKGLVDKYVDKTNKLYVEWNKDGGYQWETSNNPMDHGVFYNCHDDGSISFDGELLGEARCSPEEPRIFSELWESIEEVLMAYEFENQGFGNYKSYQGGE